MKEIHHFLIILLYFIIADTLEATYVFCICVVRILYHITVCYESLPGFALSDITFDILKLPVVGVFTPWQLANPANQAFPSPQSPW